MSPTEALHFFTEYCTATMPIGRRFEFDAAHESLRKLVVDDIARRKNQAETEKIVRPFQ